jgi:hypothetical protein
MLLRLKTLLIGYLGKLPYYSKVMRLSSAPISEDFQGIYGKLSKIAPIVLAGNGRDINWGVGEIEPI